MPAIEEMFGTKRHALGRERRQAMKQVHRSQTSGLIQGHAKVWLISQNSAGESTQDAARSDFHKDASPRAVHGLDLTDEFDGPDQVLRQEAADRLSVIRKLSGRRVGKHGNPWLFDRGPAEEIGEPALSRRDQRRMERAGNGKGMHADSLLRTPGYGPFDTCPCSGDHRLLRRIEVGECQPWIG